MNGRLKSFFGFCVCVLRPSCHVVCDPMNLFLAYLGVLRSEVLENLSLSIQSSPWSSFLPTSFPLAVRWWFCLKV